VMLMSEGKLSCEVMEAKPREEFRVCCLLFVVGNFFFIPLTLSL
jgi:hypothetical protein